MRPIGEVGQGGLAGLAAFAPAFAQEDGGWGIAVGDGFDVHGSHYAQAIPHSKVKLLITWEHFGMANSAFGNKSETYLRIWADFFWNFG